VVTARLQRDDQCAATSAVPSRGQGVNLGVRAAVVLVPALADRLPGSIEY
jgi:2-polyprenyl-6-methoxyphenol hydroxylase-like FAD-dependent oxidoreductase